MQKNNSKNKILPFPRENQEVGVVFILNENVEVCEAKVLLSKGKGIMIEVLPIYEKSVKNFQTDAKVRLFYAVENENYILRGNVVDVMKNNRFYIEPASKVEKGEKREFIRTEMKILMGFKEEELKLKQVELSGAGIKFLHLEEIPKGKRFFITLKIPSSEDVLKLEAEVVRCNKKNNEFEIGAAFKEIPFSIQQQIMKEVFKKRYEELKIEGRDEEF